MKVMDLQVKERSWPVNFLSETGQFYVDYDGEKVYAKSLNELKDKLHRSAASNPLNIPILELDIERQYERSGKVRGATIRRGVLRSVHSGNGNFIVKWDDRSGVEQVGSHSDDILSGDADGGELIRLFRAKEQAEKEYYKFMAENSIKKVLKARK